MKFSQVPTNSAPAVGDFVMGVSSGGVDQKSTIAQLAAVISANLGASVMKLLGATTNQQSGAVIPAAYTTYATITATSNGGKVVLKGMAEIQDGSSGSTRTGHIRIQCDGVTVTDSDLTWQTISSGSRLPTILTMPSHTPSAGSHTWTLQVSADTASASIIRAVQFEAIQALP